MLSLPITREVFGPRGLSRKTTTSNQIHIRKFTVSYRIKDWHAIFENNRSREIKRLDWVAIPNRMDGTGYIELVEHPNGAAHFGAWLAIVEIASKQKVRGTLPQLPAGIPHSDAEIARVLSRISRLPAALFLEVIPRLLDPHIGWIEKAPSQVIEIPVVIHKDAGLPQGDAGLPQGDAGLPQGDAGLPQGDAALHARAPKERTKEENTPPTPSKPETNPSDSALREICAAFDRHQHFHNREPKDMIVQQVLSMNGKFDWGRFHENHPQYCSFWDENGWNFCKLTFLGWINAGMPGSPPLRKSPDKSEQPIRSNLPNVRDLMARDRQGEANGKN